MQKFDQKLEQLQLERNSQIINETQKSRENQLNQSVNNIITQNLRKISDHNQSQKNESEINSFKKLMMNQNVLERDLFQKYQINQQISNKIQYYQQQSVNQKHSPPERYQISKSKFQEKIKEDLNQNPKISQQKFVQKLNSVDDHVTTQNQKNLLKLMLEQKQKQIYKEQQKQENSKVEEMPQIINQQDNIPQLKSDNQVSNLLQPKDNEALDNNQNQILNQIQEQIDQDTRQALKIHEELNQHNDQNQYQQLHNYRYYEEEIKREARLILDKEFKLEAPLIYDEDYINQEQRSSSKIISIQQFNKKGFEAFKGSQIVRNSDVEWLTKVILNNEDKRKFIEIYSAPQTTKDISNKDFIEACQDMTGPYIVLVMNSVGRRFGIYSTLKIKAVTRPTFFCDQATFIFSLDRQTFHFKKNWQSQNIGLSPDSMMILGQVQDSDGFTSEDLIIRDQQTSGLMSGSQLGNKFYYDKSLDGIEIGDTYLGDQPIFYVYLIEVYEIIDDFNFNQF
eukprot:403358410